MRYTRVIRNPLRQLTEDTPAMFPIDQIFGAADRDVAAVVRGSSRREDVPRVPILNDGWIVRTWEVASQIVGRWLARRPILGSRNANPCHSQHQNRKRVRTPAEPAGVNETRKSHRRNLFRRSDRHSSSRPNEIRRIDAHNLIRCALPSGLETTHREIESRARGLLSRYRSSGDYRTISLTFNSSRTDSGEYPCSVRSLFWKAAYRASTGALQG
jgi:hypothetical protein